MSNPTPGWYPDPAGSAQNRWWDGNGWTATLQDAEPAAAPAAAVAETTPAYGGLPAATPYSYAAAQPRLDVNPVTPFAWVLALLPLSGIISLLLSWALGDFSAEVILSDDPIAITPGTIAGYVLGFILWIGGAFIALADQRELESRGIVKPFAWAWAFIPILAPLTYLIGRTVIVKRQTGRGLTPLIVWIGITVGMWIISFAIGLILAAVLIGSTL